MTVPPRTAGRGARARPSRLEALDITVLAGGPGAEREVSLQGGQAVFEALTRLGHAAVLEDIGPDNLTALDIPADFVFLVLHGEFGEDGTVQRELDARGRRYSGSGAAASSLAMNKLAAKRHCERHGIPTPPYVHVLADRPTDLKGVPLPAVVKPVASGSSVDTSIARVPARLTEAVEAVAAKYGEALVEGYIAGPELTVGVLGDQALPVCEIRTKREFYDYQAKYLDDDTEYRFELDLPRALLGRVQDLSRKVHGTMGCRAFSRVDWMVDGDTMEPYFLEVNTIPGFTNHSLVPKAAARIGLSFDQLCQRIIELSFD